ncbi:prolipoprotein diacylglyceryl transferase [Thermoleophilum album]|uniref:Phosphatidylglycerol:prolipoprotein diacylglycerol transferase n=1 Tax=Thermoleophilum album TaxID=29539 RepID=A0A1H6FQX3_THEAL|nr:prolipoprotein diacylglyceryl transferase family protein [Thermoleophilum album]SEH12538.1 phosphatidylglycerol:prolipoprotein diacylglycerol transferase [Thermoleophilum album]
MLPTIELGPITLQTFGLAMAAAFLAAAALGARRFAELGRSPDLAWELGVAALVGGVVGARAYFLIEHWDEVRGDLVGEVFAGTGLVWYGGLLGGALAVAAWAAHRRALGSWLLGAVTAPLALGYAIGRIGCQLSGDGDYGIRSDLPWAMAYPHGTVPTTERVHPTPIYETLTMGLVAAGLWVFRDRVAPTKLFAWYLVLAGSERFLVEFVRRNSPVVAGLTAAQLIALALSLVGAAILLASRARSRVPSQPLPSGR